MSPFVSSTPCLLRQEWKNGNHTHLGKVRAYDPRPPQSSETSVDPKDYPFRLIKLDFDPSPTVKGWDKIKVSIPIAIRARYLEDPLYGASWKELLCDFDRRNSVSTSEFCFWEL